MTGMRLTLRHLWSARKRRKMVDIRTDDFFSGQEGMVTIQYPLETIPIPDNGRYRLHNEMDDCIVCDKCAKVCPVDCIDIEPIKALEEVGRASDGSPIRLYAAKFDIDMAKCCYCGLCTTVCPTECLTMTKTFDYSELDVRDMVYNFGNLSPAAADEKRMLLDQFQKEKEALKAAPKPVVEAEKSTPNTLKPVFRPGMKPKVQETEAKEEIPAEKPARPAFLPKKPAPVADKEEIVEAKADESPKPARPAFIPKKPAPVVKEEPVEPKTEEISEAKIEETPKPAPRLPFKPTMKPKIVAEEKVEAPEPEKIVSEEPVKSVAPRPVFKPKMKPPVVSAEKIVEEPKVEIPEPEKTEIQEPKAEEPTAEIVPEAEAKPKPAFRPTMKPKPKQ